jgi:hypothetical protein
MYGVKAQLDKSVVFTGISASNTIHGSRHYLINTNSQDAWPGSHSALATTGHHMGI